MCGVLPVASMCALLPVTCLPQSSSEFPADQISMWLCTLLASASLCSSGNEVGEVIIKAKGKGRMGMHAGEGGGSRQCLSELAATEPFSEVNSVSTFCHPRPPAV